MLVYVCVAFPLWELGKETDERIHHVRGVGCNGDCCRTEAISLTVWWGESSITRDFLRIPWRSETDEGEMTANVYLTATFLFTVSSNVFHPFALDFVRELEARKLCRDTGPCLIRLDQGVLVPSYISLLYPLFWLSRLSNTQHILPDKLTHRWSQHGTLRWPM
jgi:hypothetical protein